MRFHLLRTFCLAVGAGLLWSTAALGQFGAIQQTTARPRPLTAKASLTAPQIVLTAHERPGVERGIAALAKPVRSRFVEAQLVTAIKRLEVDSGCPLTIDERALADAAIGTDTLVTFDRDSATLREALDGILKPHALAWAPKSPGLLITTQEQIDTNPDLRITVVYPAYDLVAVHTRAGIEYDFDSVIDLIMFSVHPKAWKDTGTGEGIIAPYPHAAAITVDQTWEVQERIHAYLNTLREVKAKLPDDAVEHLASPVRIDVDNDRYRYRPATRQRERRYWSAHPTQNSLPTPLRRSVNEGGGFF